MGLIIPAILLLLTIPLVLGILRINELFVLRSRDSELRVIRGRIPPQLLRDINDVLAHAEVSDLELKGVSENGRAKLYAQGIRLPRPVRQQLRNTIAMWPLAKIRSAPKA